MRLRLLVLPVHELMVVRRSWFFDVDSSGFFFFFFFFFLSLIVASIEERVHRSLFYRN